MGSQTHEWSLRSSDLNPLDFYFWGYIKEVYAKEPTTAENINADILQKVRNDFRRRLDVCIQVNGGLFKHRQ